MIFTRSLASARLVGATLVVGAVLLTLTGCGPRWRRIVTVTIPQCVADLPSLSACPAAKSDAFTVAGTPWRITGGRGALRFLGVWTADPGPTLLRESRTETHNGMRSHYFDAPGRFFIFNSSPDQAVRVLIEEYR